MGDTHHVARRATRTAVGRSHVARGEGRCGAWGKAWRVTCAAPPMAWLPTFKLAAPRVQRHYRTRAVVRGGSGRGRSDCLNCHTCKIPLTPLPTHHVGRSHSVTSLASCQKYGQPLSGSVSTTQPGGKAAGGGGGRRRAVVGGGAPPPPPLPSLRALAVVGEVSVVAADVVNVVGVVGAAFAPRRDSARTISASRAATSTASGRAKGCSSSGHAVGRAVVLTRGTCGQKRTTGPSRHPHHSPSAHAHTAALRRRHAISARSIHMMAGALDLLASSLKHTTSTGSLPS